MKLPYIPAPNRQMFIVDPAVWRGTSKTEVEATITGLKEMDLYYLPYAIVDFETTADTIVRWMNKAGEPSNENELVNGVGKLGPSIVWRAINITAERGVPIRVFIIDFSTGWSEEITRYLENPINPAWHKHGMARSLGNGESTRQRLCDFLIAMLATRNIVKTVRESKLAKLGIGQANARRYCYTTTISLPERLDDDDEHEVQPGCAKAPHLRRGHIRRQHYGPGRAFEKKIWIAPVFVNADETFVNSREHYNLGGIRTNSA